MAEIQGGTYMSIYTNKMKSYLAETQNENPDIESVLQALFNHYAESCGADGEEIKRSFVHLDKILSKLTLREYDQVWDVTCKLCSDHEQRAFRAGIRTGALLMKEMTETE